MVPSQNRRGMKFNNARHRRNDSNGTDVIFSYLRFAGSAGFTFAAIVSVFVFTTSRNCFLNSLNE